MSRSITKGNGLSILPGSTIGILGSGQLGRMLAIEARKIGFCVHTYSPDKNSPTGQIANKEYVADYSDLNKVREFASDVDVITFEFENVHVTTVDAASAVTTVRPAGSVLYTTQNRLREKTFLSENGFPVANFRHVKSLSDLQSALQKIGLPAILKTADWGYDGKGQVRINSAEEADKAWSSLDAPSGILEAFVDFEREVSVVAARAVDKSFAHFGLIENRHKNHILDLSIYPANVSDSLRKEAIELARNILAKLDVVGVLCVEIFVTKSGSLIVNELAPRTHNSGHLTIDACVTNQFEQQLRAVCNLPLGSTEYHSPAAMANLLGDVWANGEPNWKAALSISGVKLHLYGKAEPRPGRKMGHLTALGESREIALERVLEARRRLVGERT
ncbi:MAG: 5-(carboxyamino)imidazole ribonucleotide synthase [candidate division Zixibacteria bacterium]|nr:5-(carboxyamino)imidazole ribonucleotide synthase [candidate division Zixibacteria bacterium]